MYCFSPTVIRLLIIMCVEDSANAVIQEFRSVVQKLRNELDNAFKNAEDLLENIGKPVECKPVEKETDSDDYEAEAKASSSEDEVKPTEPTLPASGTSEPEGVHTGIECKGCKVCTSLIADYFRSHV